MKIKLATKEYSEEIVEFFENNLKRENEALYSEEFFCPFGVKAAVGGGQIMLAIDGEEIVGAVRFYPRKRDKIISLYQFAVDEKYRGQKIMNLIFKAILEKEKGFQFLEALSPIKISFNSFYKKTG
jgi:diaminopimelate decarboxylase